MKKVTDAELLRQLEGSEASTPEPGSVPVTDKALLAELEGKPQTGNAQSIVDTFKRAVGLTGGSLAKGALSVSGLVAGGVGGMYNVGADLVQGKGQGYRVKDPTQMVSQTLTGLGLPQPESWLEKVADVGTQMLAGGLAVPIPTPKARPPAKMSVSDFTTQRGLDAGYKLPPSEKGGGALSSALESFGGKAAIKQQAAIGNQVVTDDLARAAAGLKPGDEITREALSAARAEMAEPYRQVASLSKIAEQALEKLQHNRYESNLQWKFYNRTGSPEAIKLAKDLDGKSAMLERVIEKEATKAGQPELVDALRAAREAIAKNFDVQRALNTGTAEVSAPTLARMADKKLLTGDLATIASFAKAHPRYMGEAAKTPQPGVSALNPLTSAILAGGTSALLGSPVGLAAGAIPLLRGPTRAGLLSGRTPSIPPGLVMPLFAGEEATRGLFQGE